MSKTRHPRSFSAARGDCARRATDFPELFRNFEAILAFDPDVVVHALVLNDAERAPAFEARQR